MSKSESWAPRVRAFTPTDHPHVGRPALEFDDLGELDHLGAVSDRPVELCGGHPVLFLGQQEGVTHRTPDGRANRVVEVGICQGPDEAVRGPGRVGPDHDGMDDQCGVVTFFVTEGVLGWHGTDHLLEQLEVVVGVSRGGVAGAKIAPKGSLVLSHQAPKGLNPKPRLYVAAASSFSACTSSKVESKSQIIGPTGGCAAQTAARAAATATGIARSSKTAVACTARQAVAVEATGPKSSSCSLRAAMSARQSAPSAIATARCVSTTPGSWVCQLIPHSSMATDMASVNPLRSASSAKSAAPAW